MILVHLDRNDRLLAWVTEQQLTRIFDPSLSSNSSIFLFDQSKALILFIDSWASIFDWILNKYYEYKFDYSIWSGQTWQHIKVLATSYTCRYGLFFAETRLLLMCFFLEGSVFDSYPFDSSKWALDKGSVLLIYIWNHKETYWTHYSQGYVNRSIICVWFCWQPIWKN